MECYTAIARVFPCVIRIGYTTLSTVHIQIVTHFIVISIARSIHTTIVVTHSVPSGSWETEGDIITGKLWLYQTKHPWFASVRVAIRCEVMECQTTLTIGSVRIFPPEICIGYTTAWWYIHIITHLDIFYSSVFIHTTDVHAHGVPAGAGISMRWIVTKSSSAITKRPEHCAVDEVAIRSEEIHFVTIRSVAPWEIGTGTTATAIHWYLITKNSSWWNAGTLRIHANEICSAWSVGMTSCRCKSAAITIVEKYKWRIYTINIKNWTDANSAAINIVCKINRVTTTAIHINFYAHSHHHIRIVAAIECCTNGVITRCWIGMRTAPTSSWSGSVTIIPTHTNVTAVIICTSNCEVGSAVNNVSRDEGIGRQLATINSYSLTNSDACCTGRCKCCHITAVNSHAYIINATRT